MNSSPYKVVFADPIKPIQLDDFRNALIRQEETIIFALIERAQYPQNRESYMKGSESKYAAFGSFRGKFTDFQGSLLDFLLIETEKLHALARRYTSQDEHAFYPQHLPEPILPAVDYAQILKPNTINVNSQIMNVYLQHILPGIAAEGTDSTTFGSATTADIAILQALSKRIHYGKFIAEAKFQAEKETYTTLIENNDAAGILETLTNRAVEKKVLERVKLKASTYGQDISVLIPDSGEKSFAFKVDPQLISDLYRDFVMPLTKEVEVEYLMARLDRPVVAVAGEAGSLAWMAAERHFGTLAMNTFISKERIKDVVAMVENNSIAYGLLPFEDSQIGMIRDTQICLLRGTVKIAAEIIVPKHLVIAGSVSLQVLPTDAVTKVYVPLEIITQVQNLAEKMWPAATVQPVKTAKEAVANLRNSENRPGNLTIAIITKHAAQIHDVEHTELPINFADAEEGPSAYMRMLVIAKFFPAATGNDKSFIGMKFRHHVGSLSDALTILNEHGINLSRLESIYSTDASGYDFFVEFPGHIHDTNVQAAVQALSNQICSVRQLGSCPVKSTQEC